MSKFCEEIEYNGCKLEVSGQYFPPYRSPRDSWGQAESPDEDACIEIESITYSGIEVFELMITESTMDEIERSVWEVFANHEPECIDDED